jgi:hypothetical protein
MMPPISSILLAKTLAPALLLRTASVVVSGGSIFGVVGLLAGMTQWLEAVTDSFWTYVVLGVSAIVTEELSPIFGGIAAHEGELQMARVILSITLGGWGATSLLYVLGRWKWEFIRRRFPRVRATGTVALRVVRRNQLTASLLVSVIAVLLAIPMMLQWERPPMDSTQLGFRGLGMEQITNPRIAAAISA